MIRHGLAAIVLLTSGGMAAAQGITFASWGGGVGKAWREAMAPAFTEQTGLPVEIVDVPSPHAQIRTQAGNPLYNAAITSYFEAAELQNEGLLETFDPSELPGLANFPPEFLMKTEDGRIVGVPTHYAFYGIAINTELADPDDFKSWTDLAKPEWKGQLAMIRPQFASTYDLPMYAHVTGGDEHNVESGMALLKQIADNSLAFYSSLAHANQLLERGEVAAIPYYNTRAWGMKLDGLDYIEFVIPEEDTIMLPYVTVIPKGASNREAFLQWMNYSAAADTQSRLSEAAGYLPMNPDAVVSQTVLDLLGMPIEELTAKLWSPDWLFIAKSWPERLQMVETAIAK